jgi:hypothetical protein
VDEASDKNTRGESSVRQSPFPDNISTTGHEMILSLYTHMVNEFLGPFSLLNDPFAADRVDNTLLKNLVADLKAQARAKDRSDATRESSRRRRSRQLPGTSEEAHVRRIAMTAFAISHGTIDWSNGTDATYFSGRVRPLHAWSEGAVGRWRTSGDPYYEPVIDEVLTKIAWAASDSDEGLKTVEEIWKLGAKHRRLRANMIKIKAPPEGPSMKEDNLMPLR